MTVTDVLNYLTQAFFVILGALTALDYFRHRDTIRLSIFLMFSTLALVIIIQNATTLIGYEARWASLIGTVALLAQPYLLLRIVQHFRKVPRYVERAAFASFVASTLLVIAFDELPAPVSLGVVAYFVGVEVYAAFSFIQGTRATSGVAQRRLQFAALGSLLLGSVIFLAGVALLVTLSEEMLGVLVQIFALVSALAYYIGFATPKWLRQYWQLRELYEFLAESTEMISINQREKLFGFLEKNALDVTGSTFAVTFLVQQNDGEAEPEVYFGEQLESQPFQAVTQEWLSSERVVSAVTAVTEPVVVFKNQFEAWAIDSGSPLAAFNLIYIVPLAIVGYESGHLLVFNRLGSLFVQDDLELLEMLAQQSMLVLENQKLLDELHRQNERLEERVTEATAALRQSENRFRTIAEALPVPLGITRNADGVLLFANEPLSETHRIPLDQLIGHKTPDFYRSPDERQKILEKLAADGRIQGMEVPSKRAVDGAPMWMNLWMEAIKYDGEDATLGAFFDITEQKQIQEALVESEERFRAAFEQAAVAAVQVNLDGEFLRINQRFCEITGYKTAELASMSLDDFLLVEDKSALRAQLEQLVSGEPGTIRAEKRLTRKDDAEVWVNMSVSLVRDATGAPLYFMVVAEDITKRKAAEAEVRKLNAELEERVKMRTAQLEAANKELETFTYSVSHDLRAPLRAMSGFSSQLQKRFLDDLPEKAQHYVRRIQYNAEHMGDLIDDLLTLSRLGRQPLVPRPIDFGAIIREILNELNVEEEHANALIQVGTLPEARADPILIKQVYLNLITNALKFSRNKDKPKIEIGAMHQNNHQVYFVKDNGVGFDMAFAHKLFGIFERLHDTSEFEGTGVGLATVQRIVHRHGGEVWAESEINRGTTFYFTLLEEGLPMPPVGSTTKG